MKKLTILSIIATMIISTSIVYANDNDVIDNSIYQTNDESINEINEENEPDISEISDSIVDEPIEYEIIYPDDVNTLTYLGSAHIIGTYVNLRKGPGTSYGSWGYFDNGDHVNVYNENSTGNWWYVYVTDGPLSGKWGYVNKQYVSQLSYDKVPNEVE